MKSGVGCSLLKISVQSHGNEHPDQEPLAHSANSEGQRDPYHRHVLAVIRGAGQRTMEMCRYRTHERSGLVEAIEAAAEVHDLGKLDQDNQRVLRGDRSGRLPWDHIDAGVAHLSRTNGTAAWLVRAHHAPGFPEFAHHFSDELSRRLRGRRHDDAKYTRQEHQEQIDRTDAHLNAYLDLHQSSVGPLSTVRSKVHHGLTLRLALSCLVDADHADTAEFDTGNAPADPIPCRWEERLTQLEQYIAQLPAGDTTEERERNSLRRRFFESCLNSHIDNQLVACSAPVGLGKTTAVTAYLLQQALRSSPKLRRLVIVAPFTNILSQTADTLREALTLEGEDRERVVVEHHHQADFSSRVGRESAALWNAPIVLTTAVSFFESLASCHPSTLRKLHALPGSAVFLDEAHAAIPAKLWPQNWKWLLELANEWGCRFVFASGSLTRFWENQDVINDTMSIPDIFQGEVAADALDIEQKRVSYTTLKSNQPNANVFDTPELIEKIARTQGPRIVVLNTVQNAAFIARHARDTGHEVLHLSTALTPRDREQIIRHIKSRLADSKSDWMLVATSCVEAGLDFSFRSAFRERFSVASLIQIGGRVNRGAEYNAVGGGLVFDFALRGDGITQHPAASQSAGIVREMMTQGRLDVIGKDNDLSQVVSDAMAEEIKRHGGLGDDPLQRAERTRHYPDVAKHGRVIDADTRLVVVEETLKERLARFEPVGFRDLLNGSVQLWAHKIKNLGIEAVPHYKKELYFWNDRYDASFLGVMDGVLNMQDGTRGGCHFS